MKSQLRILVEAVEGNSRGSITKFAKKVNKTTAHLNTYLSDPNRKIGIGFAKEIKKAYPLVSDKWLLLEEGDPVVSIASVIKEASSQEKKYIDSLLREIAELRSAYTKIKLRVKKSQQILQEVEVELEQQVANVP